MTGPIVPGYGNRNARIIIVGEAPASTEVKLGKPFQGKAGQQLSELLKDAGIHRDDCYITNASLRPVVGNKDDFFFERKGLPTANLIEGMKAFGEDLAEIKPCVVVPMGNYALWMLMQHMAIMSWRGSKLWSKLWGVKVVPTIHPAALLRNSGEPGSTEGGGGMWKMRPVVVWDLERVKQESLRPELEYEHREIVVNPIGQAHDDAIGRLLRSDRLTVDIESFGGTDLACVGFSDSDPHWSVTWSYDNLPERYVLFKHLLERGVEIEGQSLMYDSTMLDQLGIHMERVTYDSMIAANVIYPDFPKKLAFTSSIYTDIPYYKPEGKEWKRKAIPDLMQFWRYNGKDVCGTAETCMKQREELTERDLWSTMNRRMATFDHLRRATFRGMRIDEGLMEELETGTRAESQEYHKQLVEQVGYEPNVNSPKQMKELVYEKRKMPHRHKDGKLTTNALVLADLVAKTGDPVLTTIIKKREADKLLGTYYHKGIIGRDGRIHYVFNIAGTKFGRLSSNAPLWGPGQNLQNIPLDARRFYLADDGYEIGEFDQVQAEAVLVAYLADDPVHINCFRKGWDVHRVTACLLNDMAPEDWKSIPKHSVVRELAKRCNHALNYMLGWYTFMLRVNHEHDPRDPNSPTLDAPRSKQIHGKYMSIRPALNNYWDGIKNELRKNRTLTNLLGWPYIFLDSWSDEMLRQGCSFKPQSTVGEQTNIAIVRAMSDPEIQRMDVQFLGQVHDSIIFQWPKDNRAAVMSRIFPLLETELYFNGYRIIVPWEGKAGPNWYLKKSPTGPEPEADPLGVSRDICEVGYEP